MALPFQVSREFLLVVEAAAPIEISQKSQGKQTQHSLGLATVRSSPRPPSTSAGKHFKETAGTLTFDTGDIRKVIQVPLMPVASTDLTPVMSPAFRLMLSNPLGGVMLGQRKECRVVLVPGSKDIAGGGKVRAEPS